MKSANGSLISMLANNDQFLMAELLTFTLSTGDVYRWTTADIDIVYGGNTYKSGSSLIKRGTIKSVIGVEVDTLTITFYPSQTDTISNIKLSTAILSFGFFDQAKVELRKVFVSDWASGHVVGDLILFMGSVSDIIGQGTQIDVSVKSKMEILNAQVPRNVYQPSCMNAVYDTMCQANKAAVTVSGTVVNGRISGVDTFDTSYADGYFNQGVVTFTSGQNIGIKRTIKTYYSWGAFNVALPFPFAPAPGDTFTMFPGCDGTMSTCQNKFSNLIHFRGTPFIPVPETAM